MYEPSDEACVSTALGTKVISKQTCLIQIFKPQDTAADELFEIKFMSPQPYDDFYTAYAVIPGYQMTTPEYPGTYYYMIEPVGEEGSRFAPTRAAKGLSQLLPCS